MSKGKKKPLNVHPSCERPPLFVNYPRFNIEAARAEYWLCGGARAIMEEDLELKPDNMVEVPEMRPRTTCDLHDKEDEEEDGPADYTTTGVEKNVLKNGGIKKMVVKHGTDPSPQTPLFGDEVTGQCFLPLLVE